MLSSLASPSRRIAAGAGLSVALLLAATTAAQAQSQTRTYNTPGEYSFTVPASVTSLQVQASGGAGGNVVAGGSVIGSGGQARQVGASIPVTPGEVLYVEVGGNGGNGQTYGGGGGGGASDLRTCSMFAPSCGSGFSSLQTRLLVAGGGAGAGGSVSGGNGGDADESGDNAVGQANSAGQNGTVNGGGAPGTTAYNGNAGILGSGGLGGQGPAATFGGGNGGANGGANGGDTDGVLSGGGGGGGGYYGGGGGGSSMSSPGGGGGAGGGASYVTPGATNPTMSWTSSNPAVSLTWTPTPNPPVILPPIVSSVTPSSGSTAGGQVVTISGSYFAQARAIYFGTVAAPTYTVLGFSTISAVVPANVAGTVNVVVVGQGGPSRISTGGVFTFVAPTPTPAPPAPTPTPTPAPAPQPQLCVVPNVLGTSLSAAKRLMSQAHCAVGTVVQPTSRSGLKVVRQSIPPRTKLLPGDKVDLRMNGKRR
jgi:IPT/TIG domain-containing protein/PASTA domain-containing protein